MKYRKKEKKWRKKIREEEWKNKTEERQTKKQLNKLILFLGFFSGKHLNEGHLG